MSSTSEENATARKNELEYPAPLCQNLSGGEKGEPPAGGSAFHPVTGVVGAAHSALGDVEEGTRGTPSSVTSIDLSKPGDLALVNRAVVNGWDAPQHIRDQICDQLGPAMESYEATMRNHSTPSGRQRATMHVIKLVMLAVKMDATQRIAGGYPKGYFPYLRKRYPEKRKPRRGQAKRQEEALRRLLEKLNRQRREMSQIQSRIGEEVK